MKRTISQRVLPPFYLLGAAALLYFLEHNVPLFEFNSEMVAWLGAVVIAAALVLVGSGILLFAKKQTALRPFQESSFLVTTGPYRYTRNPMYLSMVLLLVGEGLVLQSFWAFPIALLFLALIQRKFVEPEEKMLSERFGPEYEEYRGRVGRWL